MAGVAEIGTQSSGGLGEPIPSGLPQPPVNAPLRVVDRDGIAALRPVLETLAQGVLADASASGDERPEGAADRRGHPGRVIEDRGDGPFEAIRDRLNQAKLRVLEEKVEAAQQRVDDLAEAGVDGIPALVAKANLHLAQGELDAFKQTIGGQRAVRQVELGGVEAEIAALQAQIDEGSTDPFLRLRLGAALAQKADLEGEIALIDEFETADPTPATEAALAEALDAISRVPGVAALVGKSETLRTQLRDATLDGWTVEFGPPGGGSFVEHESEEIRIDSNHLNAPPEQYVGTLAHELGHVFHPAPYYPIGDLSRQEYIDLNVEAQLTGEGYAALNNIAVRQEILAAGGPDIGVNGVGDAYYLEVWRQVELGLIDEAEGARLIGQHLEPTKGRPTRARPTWNTTASPSRSIMTSTILDRIARGGRVVLLGGALLSPAGAGGQGMSAIPAFLDGLTTLSSADPGAAEDAFGQTFAPSGRKGIYEVFESSADGSALRIELRVPMEGSTADGILVATPQGTVNLDDLTAALGEVETVDPAPHRRGRAGTDQRDLPRSRGSPADHGDLRPRRPTPGAAALRPPARAGECRPGGGGAVRVRAAPMNVPLAPRSGPGAAPPKREAEAGPAARRRPGPPPAGNPAARRRRSWGVPPRVRRSRPGNRGRVGDPFTGISHRAFRP